MSATHLDPQHPDHCPQETSEHRHHWLPVPDRRDPSRPVELDPMVGVLVYADTGDPVYAFPYREPLPGTESCRWCARTRVPEGAPSATHLASGSVSAPTPLSSFVVAYWITHNDSSGSGPARGIIDGPDFTLSGLLSGLYEASVEIESFATREAAQGWIDAQDAAYRAHVG